MLMWEIERGAVGMPIMRVEPLRVFPPKASFVGIGIHI
jgi:hypothetical protein